MAAARLLGLLVGALFGVLLALAPEIARAGAAVRGVRMSDAGDHTRFVFDLSAPARHQMSHAADPDRLILDLGDSRLQGSLQTLDLSRAPVSRIRSGMYNATDLRVVLDLASSVEAKSFLLPPGDGFGHRLVVDVYPKAAPAGTPSPAVASTGAKPATIADTRAEASPSAVQQPGVPVAAAKPAPAEAASAPAPERTPAARDDTPAATVAEPVAPMPTAYPRGRDILIAIDAGHGGQDPGALGPRRVREKDVVLAIARQLAERINQQPGYRAMLVRKGDYFIPLHKRRDIARAARADLFVSIHADAFTHSRAFGSSVYALSPRGATSVSAAFLAERENGADLIGGVNLGAKDDVLAGVLTDLSMTATMDASLGVGSRVLSSMGRVSRLHKRRVEQAGFVVLKSPDMPSILVETGFISNPTEAERLSTRHYQRAMAKAIFEGLGNYFLNTPPPDTRVAAMVRSGARPSEYVIARGDTLSGIAERYRVSVDQIVRTNRLGGAGGIQAGQRILIPDS